MEHAILLLLTLSFSLGVFSLGSAFILHRIHKKKSILYFIILWTGFCLDVFSFLFWHYAMNSQLSRGDFYFYFGETINKLGGLLMLMGLPLFIHSILGDKRHFHWIYALLLILQFALTVVHFVVKDILWLEKINKLPLYLMALFHLGRTLFVFPRIANPTLRKAIGAVLLFSLLELPVILAKEFWFDLISPEDMPGLVLFVSPLLLVGLTAISLVFLVRVLNQPGYLQGNSLTEFFLEKFGISKREEEILYLLLEGKTREEAGEELFISPNTVNNHIYNIYRKLGVKNRQQMVNLIRSNQV